jgi:hypothetical protein
MRWPRFAIAAALGAALGGCGGGEPEATPGEPATAEQPADTAAMSPAPPVSAPVTTPPTARRPMTQQAGTRAEEPWTPVHTGTVNPGMTREDVIGVWGDPVTERVADGRGYMYFRNGCEVRCGTYDVVLFDGGQVVDAIVRGSGHVYAGTSSSPAGREAMPTLPGQPGSTGMP